MRQGGAGQRWGQVEDDVLRKHDLAQIKSGDAPLVLSKKSFSSSSIISGFSDGGLSISVHYTHIGITLAVDVIKTKPAIGTPYPSAMLSENGTR